MNRILARPNPTLRAQSQAISPRQHVVSARPSLVVRAVDGVQDLLDRDKKEIEPKDVWGSGKPEPAAASASAPVKPKSQRQKDIAEKQDKKAKGDPNRPKRCKEAMDAGLALFKQKEFVAAIEMFNVALELPGNGAYRMSDSPREYSCPSDAEENAALYNMACSYAQLEQKEAALTCLAAVLDNGYSEIATIRSDPDLAPISGSDMDSLLMRYEGVFGMVSKIFRKKGSGGKSGGSDSRPWILW